MIRAAAIFLVRKDGAAYLQCRDDEPGIPYPGFWSIPGGRCDANESSEDCARRELLEEAGYRSSKLSYLANVEDLNEDVGILNIAIFWEIYDGVQSLNCFEGVEMKFIGRQEAEDLKFPRFLLPYWDRVLGQMT